MVWSHSRRFLRRHLDPRTPPHHAATDATCQRSSMGEVETDFHRIWSSPASRSLNSIEKSQHEASRHWESCPVF